MRRLLACALIACGSSHAPTHRPDLTPATTPDAAPEAYKPPAATKQLDADADIEAGGAKLAVPKQWFVGQSKDMVVLQDPDKAVTLGLVVSKAATREEALAGAWKLAEPGFSLAVAQDVELPARDGWDAIGQTAYVTKSEDRRVVLALARKKGELWYVFTIDGEVAAIDRRGAQLNAIVLDMKVPGLVDESFAGKTAQLDAQHLAKFDAFVEEARVAAGVPGVAVAVVHGGKIAFEKGYGVQTVTGKAAVTPATLFMIGSTTKSLTTLMLARLVDDGKLAWDTPVVKALPQWKLADADVTEKVTVRHTVCACTGMPRQDAEFLFEYDGWDPERRLQSMATMKPTTKLGETFQYSNLMVATGGWVGGHVFAPAKRLGPAYDMAMQALVFDPLGMKATTFDPAVAARAEHAMPHARAFEGAYEEIAIGHERVTIAVRPAGAAWSNVRDLAQFALLELAHGKRDGKQLVSEANLLERRRPQVRMDNDNAYGLGLFVTIDHGTAVIHHGGNTLGFTTDLFLLPDQDTGVIVLANAGQANAFRAAVRRAFMETVFDGKAQAKEDLTAALGRLNKSLADEHGRIAPADAAWIEPLLGPYDNADLGRVSLRKKTVKDKTGEKTTYEVDVGEWRSELGKYTAQDGTVAVATLQPPYAGLGLIPRVQDGKPTLVLDVGQQRYTFVRAAK